MGRSPAASFAVAKTATLTRPVLAPTIFWREFYDNSFYMRFVLRVLRFAAYIHMTIAWHEFADREQLDRTLARELARQLSSGIKTRGEALLAVSGGSTPRGMFARLARQQLGWNQVNVTLVDERFVPPDHRDSNERLVRENLLRGEASAAGFIPMYAAGSADAAATQFAAQLKDRLPFAALVLGMGGDGHTASWFPDSEQLAEVIDPGNAALAAVVSTPSSPHPRLTLTLPAVLQSDRLFLHITGVDKRTVLDANLVGEAAQPIGAILNHPGVTIDVYWAP